MLKASTGMSVCVAFVKSVLYWKQMTEIITKASVWWGNRSQFLSKKKKKKYGFSMGPLAFFSPVSWRSWQKQLSPASWLWVLFQVLTVLLLLKEVLLGMTGDFPTAPFWTVSNSYVNLFKAPYFLQQEIFFSHWAAACTCMCNEMQLIYCFKKK